MSKWIDIPVMIMKTYAVEVEDTEGVEHAIQYVVDDCMGDDVEIVHSNVMIAEDEHQAEQIRRLADEVLSL